MIETTTKCADNGGVKSPLSESNEQNTCSPRLFGVNVYDGRPVVHAPITCAMCVHLAPVVPGTGCRPDDRTPG